MYEECTGHGNMHSGEIGDLLSIVEVLYDLYAIKLYVVVFVCGQLCFYVSAFL